MTNIHFHLASNQHPQRFHFYHLPHASTRRFSTVTCCLPPAEHSHQRFPLLSAELSEIFNRFFHYRTLPLPFPAAVVPRCCPAQSTRSVYHRRLCRCWRRLQFSPVRVGGRSSADHALRCHDLCPPRRGRHAVWPTRPSMATTDERRSHERRSHERRSNGR